MAELRIEKVTALPGTLVANTMYLVKLDGTNEVQAYITDNSGTTAIPLKSGETQPHPFMFIGANDGI